MCISTHTHTHHNTHTHMQPKRFNSTAASLCCCGCCWVNCQSESWVVVLQSDSRQSLLPSRNVRHCRGEGHLQSASVYEGKSSQGHLHYDTGLAHTLLHSGWVGHGLCHFTLWLVPDLNQKFDVILTPHVSAVMPDHSSVVQMLHSGMWAVPSPTPEQKWAKHSWHQSCSGRKATPSQEPRQSAGLPRRRGWPRTMWCRTRGRADGSWPQPGHCWAIDQRQDDVEELLCCPRHQQV